MTHFCKARAIELARSAPDDDAAGYRDDLMVDEAAHRLEIDRVVTQWGEQSRPHAHRPTDRDCRSTSGSNSCGIIFAIVTLL